MSDINEFDIDEDNVDTPADEPQETPKALRKAAEDGKKAKVQLAAIQRELAMVKAGVDTESPVGQLFAKGYEGDITPDAVKAAWAKLGINIPAADHTDPALADPEITPDEAASTAARAALAAGAPADVAPTPDPREAAMEAGRAAISRGGTTEDALAATFDALVSAAHNGDQRVIVQTG